jgi:hypothetical protein
MLLLASRVVVTSLREGPAMLDTRLSNTEDGIARTGETTTDGLACRTCDNGD